MSKFDHLKKALSPLVLKASNELVINENFSIVVRHLNPANQSYNAAVAEYIKGKKPFPDDFFQKLWVTEYSPQGIDFVANVLMLDWNLVDDDDEAVPFTVSDALELLNEPRFGAHIYTRVIQFAVNSAQFKDKWEEEVTKN